MIWQLVDSSGVGGIESHVAALSAVLNGAGHKTKIVLLAEHGDNPWFWQLDKLNLEYQILSGGLAGLRKAIKLQPPALIHTHGYKAGIIGRPVARFCKVPVVSTFHAGERAAFPVSLYQSLDSWSSCLAGRIAVNRIIADQLPFSSEIIRNFVVLKAGLVFSQKPRAVGFVGRLSHEKGPDIFCQIAMQVDRAIPFHVFGDGPMRADLEQTYGERVQFHGVASDMSVAWPQIGLLLMPSRAEGLPMAALEALTEGIPVMATAVGALPDVIVSNHNGWLIDGNNPGEAAKAVNVWAGLTDAQRQDMGLQCRQDVQDRFGPDEPLSQILSVYKKSGWHLVKV